MREITTSTVIIKVDDSATLLAALSCVECSSGRGFVFFHSKFCSTEKRWSRNKAAFNAPVSPSSICRLLLFAA